MKNRIFSAAVFFVCLILSAPVRAEYDDLRTLMNEIDSEVANHPQQHVIGVLSNQHRISEHQVKQIWQENDDKGWGEVSLLLAASEALSRAHPDKYKNSEDALNYAMEPARKKGQLMDEIMRKQSLEQSSVAALLRDTRDRLRGMPKAANPPAGEQQIQDAQKTIDHNAISANDTTHINRLADQFQQPVELIQGVRDRNSSDGWGEIAVLLAIAKALQQERPSEFPRFSEALQHVENERNQGRAWSEVIRDHGIRLDPVIHQLRHTTEAFRQQ